LGLAIDRGRGGLSKQKETDRSPASAAPSLGRVSVEESWAPVLRGGEGSPSELLEQGLLVLGVISEDWPAWLEVWPSLEITSLVITYILAWPGRGTKI
jgi:hypothetical protein